MLRSGHLCQTDAIAVEDLGLGPRSVQPASILPAVSPEPSTLKGLKQQVIERFEREYLCRLLAGHHGNVTQAARTAGKERRELGKLLRRYQIDPRSFQPSLLCEPR
jgi:DNA-binding NtrC family response regulator